MGTCHGQVAFPSPAIAFSLPERDLARDGEESCIPPSAAALPAAASPAPLG